MKVKISYFAGRPSYLLLQESQNNLPCKKAKITYIAEKTKKTFPCREAKITYITEKAKITFLVGKPR